MAEPVSFHDFVALRSSALLRSAWLLTGDWASAQDLVQETLGRVWVRWDRITRRDAPDAYVRRVMMTTWLGWRRRRSHDELPLGELPERPLSTGAHEISELRSSLLPALRSLPPRQRAVVVLRYFEDLTEAQVAEALGCAVGTVKSQCARALAQLRVDPRLTDSRTHP